jgi:flagellar basal-body rod protein FlgF
MTQTANPLDVAIDGDGYFAVQTPDGTRYTRAGAFQMDAGRQVVTADGFMVRGDGGAPIVIPPEAQQISVGSDGSITADGNPVGKLEVAQFQPAQLKRVGGALFSATGAQRPGEVPPTVRSGVVEGSNVNVVDGVVDLVKVSRTYESLMRMIQTYHDVESRAARDLGGPK